MALGSLVVVSVGLAGDFKLSDELLEYVTGKYGGKARSRLLDWQELVNVYKNENEYSKLERVNLFFNKLRFLDDLSHWGKEDYWATPMEMLVTNGGDCDDFSIAKYFTLKEMGVPVSKMLITYVKAVELNRAHMVLTYYPSPDAEPLVLDNLINEIKPASERTDLVPTYSFNAEGLWLSKERGRGVRVGDANRIDFWRDLGVRMKKNLR